MAGTKENSPARGRHMQDEATQALMDLLRAEMRGWRDAGADTVDVSGYWKR
ncbi:hypothetical protein [Burkholderia sp. AU6039]|uniref:hypothetical protein n=1 Tax=Burkholderia sp. AU6039 TaxID=2015344 RepID=UPI0015C58B50|nr:hypothetical protein [Burkholderia sp. AU6039]